MNSNIWLNYLRFGVITQWEYYIPLVLQQEFHKHILIKDLSDVLKTVQPRHICNIGNSKCRHSFHALTANFQYMEYTDNQTSIAFWDAPVTIRIDDYWISVKSTWLYYCHIWKTVLFHYLAIISIWMEEYWPVIFTDFFSFGYILDSLSIE